MKEAQIFRVNGITEKGFFTFITQMISPSAVAIAVGGLVSLTLWFLIPQMPVLANVTIGVCIWLTGTILATHKVHGKPFYYYFSKFFWFFRKPKRIAVLKDEEYQVLSLEGATADYTSMRFAMFKDRLVSYYEVQPVNYLLMSKDMRRSFEAQYYRFLNNLRTNRVQILVKNRMAYEADFYAHLDSISREQINFASSKIKQRRERHLDAYNKNIRAMVRHGVPVRKYYIMFSVPMTSQTLKSINRAVGKLNDLSVQIRRNLDRADIKTRVIAGRDLKSFFHEFNTLQ